MKEMFFEPSELTIAANTDVTVTASNVGVLEHDFSVTDQDLTTGTVSSGSSAQVVVNLPAGTYEFFCSIPGHKEAGMIGSLIVQ
jgi:uncharacterized cupredoxin-like copper-binding protein